MNIDLTIKKTVKRFIGKIVSKLTKSKKAIIPPLETPEAPFVQPTILPPKKPEVKKPRFQWVFLQKILIKLKSVTFPQVKTQPQETSLPSRFEEPVAPTVPKPPPRSPGLMPALLAKLGKSAVGKAIKTGAQKITSWVATKLSLAAIPEPVVSKILLVLSLGLDALKLVWKGIKGIFGKIGSFLTGFLPQTEKAIQKTSGLAGDTINKTAVVIGVVIASLTAVSLPGILLLASVGGGLGAVGLTTAITVMTVGGAFQQGKGGGISNLGSPVAARPPAQTSHLAEEVIWTLNQCGITAVNKSTWAKTETCLRSSTLPNKEIIITQFHFSVYQVGPGLQCVGFVRGVMAAIGKDPGGNRDAKDYLNPPPPAGYQPLNTNMNEVKIGDLVIMRGSNDGHIGIVVEKTASSILVAQAWGTENGLIQITEINPVYFDGFLRPL